MRGFYQNANGKPENWRIPAKHHASSHFLGNYRYDYVMLNFHSLKFRIVALGVSLVLASVLLRQYVALPRIQKDVVELVAAQQLSIASYIARDIDHSVVSRLTLLGQFAADLPPGLAQRPDQLKAWLKDRQSLSPLFNGLLAVRPDGHGLIAEYPLVPGRGQLDYAALDWFQAASSSKKPVMGKPLRSRASGDPLIAFAMPVRDAAGKVVMVLTGTTTLNASGFLERLQTTRLGETGGFLLISPADKLFVGSSDPKMILKPTPPPGVNLLHDQAMAGYRGTGVTINAKGVEELSAMVSVPSTGWFVVARMPTVEAFRPVMAMRRLMINASIAMLIVILTVLLLALPRILRPLTETARSIHDMADGKVALGPLPVVRNDEVGQLVRGFNFLVARLTEEKSAREASEARLEYMAHHDSLTGLSNRVMLEDRLEQALARAERADTQIALLYCDLDGFKPINDQYGHDAGDAVLRQVGQRLSEGRRRTDTVARLGGDEFVVLLADLVDARLAANIVAQQCMAAVEEPFEFEGKILRLGMSIGIALHSGPAVEPSYLMSQADIAMYQAKHAGKGGFFFTGEIDIPAPTSTPSAANDA
jgi:diguanylate cyclase (GGDEF)-like protein